MYDFPANPAIDEIYDKYLWNGFAWVAAPITVVTGPPADVIPVNPPVNGQVTVQASLEQLANESAGKVDIAGDTMTGPLILSEHPTLTSPALQAATRQYVESIALPPGGTLGQTLAITSTGTPAWGAVVDAGNF